MHDIPARSTQRVRNDWLPLSIEILAATALYVILNLIGIPKGICVAIASIASVMFVAIGSLIAKKTTSIQKGTSQNLQTKSVLQEAIITQLRGMIELIFATVNVTIIFIVSLLTEITILQIISLIFVDAIKKYSIIETIIESLKFLTSAGAGIAYIFTLGLLIFRQVGVLSKTSEKLNEGKTIELKYIIYKWILNTFKSFLFLISTLLVYLVFAIIDFFTIQVITFLIGDIKSSFIITVLSAIEVVSALVIIVAYTFNLMLIFYRYSRDVSETAQEKIKEQAIFTDISQQTIREEVSSERKVRGTKKRNLRRFLQPTWVILAIEITTLSVLSALAIKFLGIPANISFLVASIALVAFFVLSLRLLPQPIDRTFSTN
jgi:hypothetical protein